MRRIVAVFLVIISAFVCLGDEIASCGVNISDYTGTVTRGQVRFVSQKTATAALYGWGKYAKDKSYAHGPAHNCTSAVQSMAFSYIGIDAPPEKIVAQITGFVTNYGFDEADTAYRTGYSSDEASLEKFLNRFYKDAGAGVASPVILHFQNGKTKDALHQHCVLVIGKDDDGRYIAIDPAQDWDSCIRTFTLKKNKNGRFYLSGDVARGNERVYIDAIEQYYLVDPGLSFFD